MWQNSGTYMHKLQAVSLRAGWCEASWLRFSWQELSLDSASVGLQGTEVRGRCGDVGVSGGHV